MEVLRWSKAMMELTPIPVETMIVLYWVENDPLTGGSASGERAPNRIIYKL
jgi:hypothetical protein